MYIIVKDVCHDFGRLKRIVVLNKASYCEAFRSKACALRALNKIVKDTGEEYENLNDEKYCGFAYSLFGGAEIFYVYKLHVDNRL